MTTKAGKKDREPALTYVDIVGGASLPRRPFYLVTGSDLFAFSEMEKIFRKRFLPDDPSGFSFHRFDCEAGTKAASILSVCEEYPFGSTYKVVVLHSPEKISAKEGEKIRRYLEQPMDTTVMVIFEWEEEYGASSSEKFRPSRDLKNAVKNVGLHIPCKLSPQQMKAWLQSRFTAEGKKADYATTELLIDVVGADLWDLSQEVTKIAIYVGKRDVIKEEDVRTLTAHRPQSKIFNITEQVGAKHASKALLILDELLKEKVAGAQVLSALNRHFTFLVQLYELNEQSLTADDIAKKIRKHPFYVKKSLHQATNFSKEQFETAFDLMARADAGMKSGMDERMVLELLIIQLCRMKS